MLQSGDKAPNFSLPDSDGKTLKLKDLKGKKVVLYFYPKDMTSGCTKQACSFQQNLAPLKKQGAVVIGVSADNSSSHRKFSDTYGLTFPLLADVSKEASTLYQVWKEKSMYGRKYMGIERTTFVIDEKGIITHIFRKVKVEGHVKEILDTLEK